MGASVDIISQADEIASEGVKATVPLQFWMGYSTKLNRIHQPSKGVVMSEELQPKPAMPTSLRQRILIYAVVLLVVFLLGFIPMWLKARGCGGNLAKAQRELSLAHMQNTLASATIDARRGDYEPARQSASDFFTSLSAEADKGAASALTDSQKQNIQPLFAGRDEVITLLARSDPASADRLSDLYASYRKVMSS